MCDKCAKHDDENFDYEQFKKIDSLAFSGHADGRQYIKVTIQFRSCIVN